MKRCPTCNRSYTDDTLTFCLQDGSQLTHDHDSEATVIAPPLQSAATNNSHRIYQVIIILLVLGGAGVGLYFALSSRGQPTEAATVAQPSSELSRADTHSLPANQNAEVKPSPIANTNTLPANNQPAIPKIYGKTYGAARKLLIQEGWLPDKRQAFHGQEVDVQSGNGPIFWQRGYWELETCSGTGSAFCLFEFTDPTGRLLEVVTEGEEDEAGTYHAHVSRVYLKKK